MDTIFVFGSNLAGRHGKGAALHALKHHGAEYGKGVGPQGNSYAIPTKSAYLGTLPLPDIRTYVKQFLAYAKAHPDQRFQLTAIGCGLAGYEPRDIATMFRDAPPNVALTPEFKTELQIG